jgi:DNA repair protein RadC
MMDSQTTEPRFDLESPHARLRRLGADTLSDEELLAILLDSRRTAVGRASYARKVLHAYGGLRSLVRTGLGELSLDLGERNAARLCVANELVRRAMCERLQPGLALRSSRDVLLAYGPMAANTADEILRLVLLDVKQRPLLERVIARGGATSCLVSVRDVFAVAVRESAAAMIVVHNHPSGDPAPSTQDIELTQALARAGHALGLPLIDHVILGHDSLFSFLDAGLLTTQASDEVSK